MERHEFPLFIPAPYSLPPQFKRWGVKWGGRGTNWRRKNKNLRLTANGSSPTAAFETRKHNFLPKEDLKDSGHNTCSGVGWGMRVSLGDMGIGRGRGGTGCRQYPGLGGGLGVGRLHDAIRRAAEGTQVNTILHIVLFQLGQDVFSIRVLPQGGNVRPDLYRHQYMWTGCTRIALKGLRPAGFSVLPGRNRLAGNQWRRVLPSRAENPGCAALQDWVWTSLH